MYPVIFELPNWFPFLGGAPITSFGVFMLLSFLTGGYVLQVEMRRMGQDPEQAWDLVFWAVGGGGARGGGFPFLRPPCESVWRGSLSRFGRWRGGRLSSKFPALIVSIVAFPLAEKCTHEPGSSTDVSLGSACMCVIYWKTSPG